MAQIYCSNCGKMIPENSNFCRFCGASQHGQAATVYRATAPPAQPQAPLSQPYEKPPVVKASLRVVERRRLSPRAVWLFFIGYVAKTSILAIIFVIGLFFDPSVFGLGFILYVSALYIMARVVYQSFYFEITEQKFRKEFGVIHKSNVTIPFEKVQNVNITRSLLDRMLGLARIDIETAGTASETKKELVGTTSSKAEGHLPGIVLEEAKEIHDVMLERFAQLNSP